MDGFLYDNGFRHERVKQKSENDFGKSGDKCTRSSEIKISKRAKNKISFSKVIKTKVPNFQENSSSLQLRRARTFEAS